jgi:stage II sporulation protein D
MDALKAQAIASRSYALFQKRKSVEKPYDVESTTASQVFSGTATTDRARTAVLETAGEVALFHGEVAETFFHASAGGRTESLPNVWDGEARPYLVSRPAKYETDSPHFQWKTTIDAKTIQSKLMAAGYKVGAVNSVRVKETTNTGRAKNIDIYHDGAGKVLTMSGNRFRIIIGAMKLRSTRFLISHRSGSLFTFKGAGFGHGVGMSQWSAKGMAESGDDYRTIIAHFYPGVTIGSMVTDGEPPSLFAWLFGK